VKPEPKEQNRYAVPDSAIAAELGVSRQRVDQIADSAMQKLRKELERRGIKFVSDVVPE
jgi:DNA-directed RNA polymerase sigma subunit (sigma70/sigma32)